MNKKNKRYFKICRGKTATKEATLFKVITDDQYYRNGNKKLHKKEQNDLTLME